MYSPKISEDLIPILYMKVKENKMPMTKIVDDILRDKLHDKVDSKTDNDVVYSPVKYDIEI